MAQEKVAIYARVSSDVQKEADTIKSQLTTLPEYAQRQNWRVVDTYIDEGKSGATIEGRPEFQRLLADMKLRKFNIVLVAEVSRVTRSEDLEQIGHIINAFKNNNIKLASPADGLMGAENFSQRLMVFLKLGMSGDEKAKMVERFKRGRRQKLRDGKFVLNSVEPYGFRKIVKRDEKGRPETQFLMIDETEGNVLRTIYDRIMEGNTLRQVCKYLNERKVFPREAKSWKHYNLSRILDNTSLYGQMTLFEDEKEPIIFEVPRIFTKAEWKEMRAMINLNRTRKGRFSDHFLFRGRLKCSLCGGPMMLLTLNNGRYKYYVCRYHKAPKSRLPKGKSKCEGAPMCRADVLDKLVLRKLLAGLLLRPEETIREWTLDKGKMVELKSLRDKLASLNMQRKQLKGKREKLVDLYLNEGLEKTIYNKKHEELETAANVLKIERDKTEGKLRKVEETQANVRALKSSQRALERLPKTLYDRIMGMDAENLTRLIEYLVPPGNFITVSPTEPYIIKPAPRKLTLFDKPVKVTFGLSYVGVFNIKALIHALKLFDKKGKIPSAHDTRYTCGSHSP